MTRHTVLTTLLCAGLALAGCKAGQPQATVSSAEASLAALGRVSLAYLNLPPCPGLDVCAQPAIKAQMKAAYDRAYALVTQAQATADAGGTPDLTAATAALQALQSLVDTYGKGA